MIYSRKVPKTDVELKENAEHDSDPVVSGNV